MCDEARVIVRLELDRMPTQLKTCGTTRSVVSMCVLEREGPTCQRLCNKSAPRLRCTRTSGLAAEARRCPGGPGLKSTQGGRHEKDGRVNEMLWYRA
jgi:hypothetical protein